MPGHRCVDRCDGGDRDPGPLRSRLPTAGETARVAVGLSLPQDRDAVLVAERVDEPYLEPRLGANRLAQLR